jgi:hypothetical protein
MSHLYLVDVTVVHLCHPCSPHVHLSYCGCCLYGLHVWYGLQLMWCTTCTNPTYETSPPLSLTCATPPPWMRKWERNNVNPRLYFPKWISSLLKLASSIPLVRVLTHSCQTHSDKIRCVVPPHIASPFKGV